MNFNNIGGGIRLVHPWKITVIDNAVLGENVTLFKGSIIGVITSGRKEILLLVIMLLFMLTQQFVEI